MPRRDVGNEVIVALAAIGMLALALTFGVVLTLSRSVATQSSAWSSKLSRCCQFANDRASSVARLMVV